MSKKIISFILTVCVVITAFSSVACADGIVVEQGISGINVTEFADGIKLTGNSEFTQFVFVKITDGTNVVCVNQFTLKKGVVEERCYFKKPTGTMHVYLNSYTPIGAADIEVEKNINSEGIKLDVREVDTGVQLYGTVDCKCPAVIKITDQSGNVIYFNQYNFNPGNVLENCNFKWPSTRSINVLIYSRDSSVILKDIYVSPEGNDSNTGTELSPFKTLKRVQSEIESVKKSLTSTQKEDITVYLRGGTYYATEDSLFNINSASGGTDNVSVHYTAYNDEKVYLSAGVKLPYSAFGPVSDEAVLARLSDGVEAKVLCADLLELNIGDYGSHIHFNHGINYDDVNQTELFVDGNAMNVARWPDKGFAYTGYTSESITADTTATEVTVESVENRALNWKNEKYGQIEVFVDQNFGSRFSDIKSVVE